MGREREPASPVAGPLSFVHTNEITRCRGNPCGCPLCTRNPASALLHLLPHDRRPSHFAILLLTAVICVFCRGASRTARAGSRLKCLTAVTPVRRCNRIVLRLTRIPVLDNKVPSVPVEPGAVNHVVASGLYIVPVGHQPVFVVANEEVCVSRTEKAASHAFSGAEPLADYLEEFPLSVFFSQHVLVGPRLPVGNRLPPGSVVDQLRNSIGVMLPDPESIGETLNQCPISPL